MWGFQYHQWANPAKDGVTCEFPVSGSMAPATPRSLDLKMKQRSRKYPTMLQMSLRTSAPYRGAEMLGDWGLESRIGGALLLLATLLVSLSTSNSLLSV